MQRILLLALLPPLCSCAPRLDAIPRFGQVDIDGTLGLSSTGVVVTADVDTFGLEKDDGVFGGRIDLEWGSPQLTVSTQTSSHGGTGVLAVDISEGGITIPAGTTVTSDFDLGIHSAILTFDFVPTEMIEAGVGLGVTVLEFDAAITDSLTGLSVAGDESLPIPVLAARAGVELGNLEATALLSGLAFNYGDTDGSFFDFDLLTRYRIIGGDDHLRGSLVLGYRLVSLDLEADDGVDVFEADFDFEGPYFGLQISL